MNQKIQKNRKTQTLLSLIILATLIAIVIGVIRVQSDYYPAVSQLSSMFTTENNRAPIQSVSSETALISLSPEQMPLSPLEAFGSDTLSDKINGKAEMYLSAGFIRLHSQRFKTDASADVWMEAFVYEMATPQNAFAVFSAQRREDAQTLSLGQYAYQTPNALFFVQGPYYIEIIASDVSETIYEPMISFAKAFIEKHPFEAQTLTEEQLFPQEGLVSSSIALVSADAFGYERFDQVFTATYALKDAELMAYFSRRKTPQEAEELAFAYSEFLTAFGGKPAESNPTINGARTIHILDTYEVIFSHGPYLAGVREATDKKQAHELAARLFNRIKEATHGS